MPSSETRKKDHIEMSFSSVPDQKTDLGKLTYEPLLAAHPKSYGHLKQTFLGFDFSMPLWISSMTGGTQKASHINQNLARACGEFGLGMGLGSCRPLLDNHGRFEDFNVKHLMNGAPLFTNFGVAQLEQLIDQKSLSKIEDITQKLKADGIVIHVNPLQEWAQEGGDRYARPAIETIQTVCEETKYPIIVKEVGQGMGPQSLKALCDLPIAAIELAAYGGTNFSILERRRQCETFENPAESFNYIGHSAEEMIDYLNQLAVTNKNMPDIIISGGIKDPLTGYILKQNLKANAVIGMASTVLKYALGSYEELSAYLKQVQECFAMADAFLHKSQ